MANRTLPEGWRWVRFGEVVREVRAVTRDPESDGLRRVVGLEHINSGSLPLERWSDLSDLSDGTSFTRVFRAGQVLFGKRRAYQRKVAVPDFDGICSSDILVFEPCSDDLLAEFLPYIVQSEGFFDHALGTSAGSLSPRTKWQELAKYEFALPDRDVQLSTLELLRVLSSEAVALREAAGAARALEAAVVASLAHLPGGTVGPLSEVLTTDSQGVQVGPFGGSLSSRYFSTEGVVILKINNITQEGRLDLCEVVRTPESHAATLHRYRVREGDVVTAAQATIGRTALVTPDAVGALISQHLIRVRVDPSRFRPELLTALFNSPLVIRQMEAVKTKTTRDGLNTADVEAFQIPLASVRHQDEVLSRLAVVRVTATCIERNQSSLKALRTALVDQALGQGRL